MKRNIIKSTLLAVVFTSSLACYGQIPPGFKDFDVAAGLSSSSPIYLNEYNNKLYFFASDGTIGREPHYIESAGIPTLIKDMSPGPGSSMKNDYMKPSAFMNGKYYFTSDNGYTGQEIYMYDGTNAPTIVFDPNFGADSSSPDNYTVFNGKLYYTAITATEGRELWVYDGTNAPSRLTDINPGPAHSITGQVIVFANKIYFVCNTPTYGSELWSYNTLTNTAALEADIDTGVLPSNPANLTVIGSKMYFSATTFQHGRELYVYDGTNNPIRLTDINANSFSSLSPVRSNAFALYNGKIYFNGRDSTAQGHLWSYNPAGGAITLEYKINPSGDSGPREFVVYNNRLFFTANDGASGFELYAYDGTNPPTMIGDLCPGPNSSLPSELTPIGNELYFAANNCSNSGIDLFSYNHERVGIRNILFDADVIAFPNPVDKELHIEMNLKSDEQLRIRLVDITGRDVYDGGMLNYSSGKTTTNIPTNTISNGIYIYSITNKEGKTYLSGKVLKQ